jgi:hypothetical protein
MLVHGQPLYGMQRFYYPRLNWRCFRLTDSRRKFQRQPASAKDLKETLCCTKVHWCTIKSG